MRLTARLIAPLAAVAALSTLPAGAADYRLPPPPPLYEGPSGHSGDFNWGGIYGGIHAGVTSADIDFGQMAQQLATDAYTNLVAQDLAVDIARLRSSGSDRQNNIGGFIGYNLLYDDVVVGVELEYTHMMDKMVYQDSFSDARRRDRGGFSDAVSYNVSARGSLADYGILKLRAGYPMGRFLPFATIGLVVGEQRLSGSYNSSYTEYLIDPVTGGLGAVNVGPVARNASSSKTGFNIGAAFGLGIDWAVLDNFMLRAEYQYIAMSDYKGMETTANAFRLGAGVKY